MQQLVAQFLFCYFTVFAIYAETHTAVIHGDDVFKIGDRIKVSRQSGFHNRPNRHGNLSNIIGTVIASVGWSL